MLKRYLFLNLLLLPIWATPAHTADNLCTAKACFSSTASIAGEKLPLHGISLFTYWMFKIYSGAFYVEGEVDSPEKALAPVKKYLVLKYHTKISGKDFAESTQMMLEKNPDVDVEAIKPQLEKLYKTFRTVDENDRYSIFYRPGRGTTLYLNDEKQAEFPGDEFQRAFFGIWLSSHSVKKDFTEELLKKVTK